ncbi:MAG: hypothetical protein C4516_03250 [Oxalobacter sp.]|nr:MAG: hypothetical protein C4516_03250 [Oxalobacter sp.]
MKCTPQKKWAFLLTLLACPPIFAADSTRTGVGADVFFSTDSENFHTQRIGGEYLPLFQHIDSQTGVRYSHYTYEQNDWSRSGQQISVLHRNIDPKTAYGWQMEAGIFQQHSRDLLTLDGSFRTPIAKQTNIEFFINRNWVETANALDNGINFTYGGASIEQGLGQHVTLVGLAGYQDFSDGNHRNHGRVRFIYQPDLNLGLTLQAQYRVYTSAREDVDGAYFNPDRYDEGMLLIGWRQRILGWMANARAGIGRQKVEDDDLSPTKLLEVSVQNGTKDNYGLRLRGGYSQSASFHGPDYRYKYVQAEWVMGF